MSAALLVTILGQVLATHSLSGLPSHTAVSTLPSLSLPHWKIVQDRVTLKCRWSGGGKKLCNLCASRLRLCLSKMDGKSWHLDEKKGHGELLRHVLGTPGAAGAVRQTLLGATLVKRRWAPGAHRTDGHSSRHRSCLARVGRGAGRRQHGGVAAAVASAKGNWEPSTPVPGEPIPPSWHGHRDGSTSRCTAQGVRQTADAAVPRD